MPTLVIDKITTRIARDLQNPEVSENKSMNSNSQKFAGKVAVVNSNKLAEEPWSRRPENLLARAKAFLKLLDASRSPVI